MKMILISILSLLLVSLPANATEFFIGIHTYHPYGEKNQFFEQNGLFGIKHEGYIIASFQNSYERPGTFVGRYVERDLSNFRIGAVGGVISSYCPSKGIRDTIGFDPCIGGWLPVPMVYGGYQYGKFHGDVVLGHAVFVTIGISF